MVDDDILKEAREEFLKQQELKKNKPAGKPCEKCNCIVEPERIVELNRWSCASECESCEEKERNEKEAEKTKYMQQITKEEREIIDSILSRNNEKKANRANSGIKGVLWDMTFDTFKDGGAIYNFAKKYANEFYRYQTKQGIYIFGKVSSGKTHLSCAIANYILDNSTYSIKLIKAIDLLFNARDYNTNKNEAHFIDDLNKYDLLIIDDLGSEKLSEWAIQVIYKLIDDRMLKKYYPLIVTSNLSLQELEEKIGGVSGERIVSRLASMCKVIKMPDRNFRLENNKYKKETKNDG